MRKFALLVGVEHYEDRSITPVAFARVDAMDLATRLRERCRFDIVRTLADATGPDAPTLGRIVDAMDELACDLRSEDILLFYFGGHGVEINGQGHLLTSDTRRRKLSLVPTLPLADVKEIFERADAGKRILLLDSCRNNPLAGRGDANGSLGKGFCRDVIAVAEMSPKAAARTLPTTALLSACWSGQRAWPLNAKRHGVFTHFLLEGIDHAAWRNDQLDFEDLATYAGEEVTRWSTTSLPPEDQQTCYYQKFGTPGRLVLAVRPGAARQTPASSSLPGGAGTASHATDELKLTPVPAFSHEALKVFSGHAGRVCSVAFAPEGGRVASAGQDRTIRLWDILTGKQIRQFDGHGDTINCVAFSPDGRWIASASVDRTVRLWTVGSGRKGPHYCLEGHRSNVNSVAFSSDGRYLLSGSGGELRRRRWVAGNDDNLRLWDVDGRTLARCFDLHGSFVWSVAVSPDGHRAVSGGWGRDLSVWDITTGKLIKSFSANGDEIRYVAFSPNGRLAACGNSDGTIRVWTLESIHTHLSHEIDESEQTKAAPWIDCTDALESPSGEAPHEDAYWTRDTDEAESKHNVIDGFELNQEGLSSGTETCFALEAHNGEVAAIAFAWGSRFLVSGGGDKQVRVWDLDERREVRSFGGHGGEVNAVAWSSDGRWIASAGADATVRLWQADLTSGETQADELFRQAQHLYTGVHGMIMKDHSKAARLLWSAALAGHAEGQNLLGWLYLNAQGVPRDFRQAAILFARAAAQGHAKAQFNLAWRYVKGEGVPKDEAKAREWFQRAAHEGHRGAREFLDRQSGEKR